MRISDGGDGEEGEFEAGRRKGALGGGSMRLAVEITQ